MLATATTTHADDTWTAYLPPLFLLTRQTTRQTPRRKMMARSIPMNQPEEARVLWRCCGPAAMFRYVFTLCGIGGGVIAAILHSVDCSVV